MTPEGALLAAVKDLLTAERVWFCRMNTGSIMVGEGQSRRCFTSGRKGMADVLALPSHCIYEGRSPVGVEHLRIEGPRILWLELKSPKGVQSLAQKEFQREVEAEGHTYLLIRDVRQLQTWLKENS